jgi:hypothetical protein
MPYIPIIYNDEFDVPENNDFIPKIVNIFYDSGTLPEALNINNYNNIITPATYFDSGPKNTDGIIKYYGFDIILDQNDFLEVGIDELLQLKSNKTSSNIFTLKIKLKNNLSLNTTFNDDFKPINNDIIYFKGNPTKKRLIINISKSIRSKSKNKTKKIMKR